MGKSQTDTYITWNNMMQRCYSESYRCFKDYGGRGITVCLEWHDYEKFHEDMGDRPFKKAQLDRRETDGNYNKDNCRWTTSKINTRNRRSSVLNERKVRRIRKMSKSGLSNRCIADSMKISSQLVYSVVIGKTWKGV